MSGESTVENKVAGVGRDESELEWLVRGCRSRRVAGSWLQRRGEACMYSGVTAYTMG